MVQSFYEGTRAIEARFFQTYYLALYDRYERSRGEVVFLKPGKMRWDYDRPEGKVIVSDGRTLQVLDPGGPRERPQLFVHGVRRHELPQAFAFLTGEGELEQSFSLRLLEPERQGFDDGYVLELRPRQPSPHYERVLLYVLPVQRDGEPAGRVERLLIVDHQGNRNRFDFSEIERGGRVSPARFRLRPPPGTRRVRP